VRGDIIFRAHLLPGDGLVGSVTQHVMRGEEIAVRAYIRRLAGPM
jgi:hypothetical protein